MLALAIDPLLRGINDAVINPLIALLFIGALVVFIWGVVSFVANAGNEAERVKGKRNILYGIIGMVIMVSVFSIMNLLINTFKLNETERGGGNPIDHVILPE